MYEVIMPKLGLTMETGKVEKWRKKEGDKIEAGEILFDIMTDKVSLEVEAYNSGYLRKIIAKEDEEVPVTNVIAYIGELDEEIPLYSANKVPEYKKSLIEETKKPEIQIPMKSLLKEEAPSEEPFVKISPLAKKLAKELGIDYLKERIKGTGPGGRITNDDIISFKEIKEISYAGETLNSSLASESNNSDIRAEIIKIKSVSPLKGVRKVIADKMTYSKQNIPHIIQTMVISADNLLSFREKIKNKFLSDKNIKITYTDLLIMAVSRTLKKHENINSSLQDGNHIIYEDINVAIGIANDRGLAVATLFNSDKSSLYDIAKKRTELVDKTKTNTLKLEEISNATFTISNLGMFRIRNFTAIINPPQGAILMVGEIYNNAAEEDGKIVLKSFMDISLAVDHRIIDGADSARFLLSLRELLENPELLAI